MPVTKSQTTTSSSTTAPTPPSSFCRVPTRSNLSTIDLSAKGISISRPQQRRPNEMAALHRLRQTRNGRDHHRAIQIHHRTAYAGPVVPRSADRSRHRLLRSQPHACLRTPEIRPPPESYGILSRFKERKSPKFASRHQRRSSRIHCHSIGHAVLTARRARMGQRAEGVLTVNHSRMCQQRSRPCVRLLCFLIFSELLENITIAFPRPT